MMTLLLLLHYLCFSSNLSVVVWLLLDAASIVNCLC